MAEPCIKKHPIDQDCMPQLNTLDQYCHLRGIEIVCQLVAVKFKLGHKHRTLGRLPERAVHSALEAVIAKMMDLRDGLNHDDGFGRADATAAPAPTPTLGALRI